MTATIAEAAIVRFAQTLYVLVDPPQGNNITEADARAIAGGFFPFAGRAVASNASFAAALRAAKSAARALVRA